MRTALTALAGAAMLLASAGLRAQPAQAPATGLILGRVIEATSGAPIRGATVRIFDDARVDREQDTRRRYPGVITDNDGQFVFSAVPAGSYRLHATKFGHADGAFGVRRPDLHEAPPLLVMAAGERRGDVTIRVWKHAAITGTVVDEFGEPVVGVEVRAFPRAFAGGRPKLGMSEGGFGHTDDRGVYRLSRLVAGDYVVAILRTESATPASIAARLDQLSGDQDTRMALYMDLERAGVNTPTLGDSRSRKMGAIVYAISSPPIASRGDRLFVYPSQFYGGTAQVSTARTIAVRSGEEVAGIDFAMRPVPSFSVSGTVTDQNGPVANLPIRLTTPGTGDFEIERQGGGSTTITDEAGQFTLVGVTPGQHVLRSLKGPGGEVGWGMVGAFVVPEGGAVISTSRDFFPSAPPAPRAPTLYAHGTVGVSDADVNGLAIVVRNGVRLSGRVEFVGARDQPDAKALARTTIVLESRDGTAADWDFEMTGKVTEARQFETVELPPGSYLVRVPDPPEGWSLESVMVGGRDMSDIALDVTDKPVSSIVVRFTDKPSMLAGAVRVSASDERADEALVLAFPTDRARWVDYGRHPRRVRQTGVSQDGTYAIGSLPPGEYFVMAVRHDFLNPWSDPALLEKLAPLAARVTIGQGEQKTLGLVMGRVR